MDEVDDTSCEVCRFAAVHSDNDGLRFCRRQCPAETGSNGHAKWPIVSMNDWCGDFEEAMDG